MVVTPESQPVKRLVLVRRHPDMSAEEFGDWWTRQHAALAAQLPGLTAYRISLVDRWLSDDPGWDGVGELWFEDEQTMEESLAAWRSRLDADLDGHVAELRAAIVVEHRIV